MRGEKTTNEFDVFIIGTGTAGECRFDDAETLICGDQTIRARRFLIATGATPRPLPIPGGDLAGELVNLLTPAARQGTTAAEFREIPWAYPTYSSDLKYMLG